MFGLELKLPKLSDNEKKLLYFAGGLVAVAFYIMVIFLPHFRQVMSNKGQYDTMVKKEKEYKVTLSKVDEVKKKFNDMMQETMKSYTKFYPYVSQKKFIGELSEIADKTGVGRPSFVFSEETMETLGKASPQNKQAESKNKAAENKEDKKAEDTNFEDAHKKLQLPSTAIEKSKVPAGEKKELNLKVMSVTVEFKSGYEAAFAYIRELSSRVRKPIISDANISIEKDGSFKTTLGMKFYVIPYVVPDANFDQWEYQNPTGKDNPFSVQANAVFGNPLQAVGISADAVQKASTQMVAAMPSDETAYDLFVSAKPITADVPTVIVGKGGDSSGSSYVYADSDGVEEVTLTISGTEGNYTASYKTSKESKSNIPITLKGDIFNVCLMSTDRVSATDTSGINLTIYNTSNKSVILERKSEDVKRERIKVTMVGNISYK